MTEGGERHRRLQCDPSNTKFVRQQILDINANMNIFTDFLLPWTLARSTKSDVTIYYSSQNYRCETGNNQDRVIQFDDACMYG